jgi:hypothetical protein
MGRSCGFQKGLGLLGKDHANPGMRILGKNHG